MQYTILLTNSKLWHIYQFVTKKLMDRLPKDVVNIIYRLVFDYDYCSVKIEYSMKWTSKHPIYKVYWCDKLNLFRGDHHAIANWRSLEYKYKGPTFKTYKFNDRANPLASLPINY